MDDAAGVDLEMASLSELVEIVIPTYGRPEGLALAIESALVNTPFRVTVLDDHSPDPVADTADVRVLETSHGERLRIIRNSFNLGASLNILRALEVSRAPYTWPFADDWLMTPEAGDEVAAAIEQDPEAAVLYWHAGLPAEERHHIATLLDYVELIEQSRAAYGFSDNFFHRVVRTNVGRRYVRLDARFSHAQPTLGIQLAALTDQMSISVRGGILSRPAPGNRSSWSLNYAHRFKLDPGYLIDDPELRRRYRAVVAEHFPWRAALIDLESRERGSIDEEFAMDAARMVGSSGVRLRLRVEARLALWLRASALGRLFGRLVPSKKGEVDRIRFQAMKW